VNTITIAVLALALVAAPVLVSYLVEALRRRPTSPSQTSRDPGILISYADLDGTQCLGFIGEKAESR